MSSGFFINVNGVKTDLEELVELARIEYDNELSDYGFKGEVLKTAYLKGSHPFGVGININNYDNKNFFKSDFDNIPLLMEKGVRPRYVNPYLEVSYSGGSQRYYYMMVRTETTLYLLRSTSSNSKFSSYQTWSKSTFPKSGIPKYMYAQLVGGGAGGGGGAGWGIRGGGGGGGGGTLRMHFPVRTISSIPTSPSSADYVFSPGNGGAGSTWVGGGLDQMKGGGGGQNSVCYLNGSTIAAAGGGKGSPNKSMSGGGGGTCSGSSPNIFSTYTGTNGSAGATGWDNPGNSSGKAFAILFLGERQVRTSSGALGGNDTAGGGAGGASWGNGGNGVPRPSYTTGIGGGGGGGPGGWGKAGYGKNGGAGEVRFFY